MPQIGQFTRTPSGYSGRVRTLSLDLELTFVPAEKADVENAPACRIHLGGEDDPEVGAGWNIPAIAPARLFPSCSTTLSLRARLFQSDDAGHDWGMHWTRQKKREEQE